MEKHFPRTCVPSSFVELLRSAEGGECRMPAFWRQSLKHRCAKSKKVAQRTQRDLQKVARLLPILRCDMIFVSLYVLRWTLASENDCVDGVVDCAVL